MFYAKFPRAGAFWLLLGLFGFSPVLADSPKPFGPDDQAGASNLITPDKVRAATALIREGRIVPLGRVYEAGMPLFGDRVFALRATNGLDGGPFGENGVAWTNEFLATEIGQVGTQFDGLGHIGTHTHGESTVFYNGHKAEDIFGRSGLTSLGIEHVKPFFTRGVVLDIVALRGRNLERGEEITVADIKAAFKRQKLAPLTPGDVVLFHTGWGRLWMVDNAKYNDGEPGIGVEAARFLSGQQVAVVGADVWGVEAHPNPNPDLVFPAHQELIIRSGIFLHENLATERLIEADVSEFAYIYTPLPIKGASGSPGSPLAVF